MKISKYVKKPIPIEAVRIFDILDPGLNIDEYPWLKEALTDGGTLKIFPGECRAEVHTLEGVMHGSLKDYLIHGVRGELYICEESIFEETYQLAD